MTTNQSILKTSNYLLVALAIGLLTAILAGACSPACAARSGGAGACRSSRAATAFATGIDGDLGDLLRMERQRTHHVLETSITKKINKRTLTVCMVIVKRSKKVFEFCIGGGSWIRWITGIDLWILIGNTGFEPLYISLKSVVYCLAKRGICASPIRIAKTCLWLGLVVH